MGIHTDCAALEFGQKRSLSLLVLPSMKPPSPELNRPNVAARGPLSGADAAVALREKRYPPLRIAAAVQALATPGVDAVSLLHGAGLSLSDLGSSSTRVSSLQFLTVARNAVRLVPGDDAGLRVGLRMHVSSYGMYGYALLCAETLRQSFDFAVRYFRLASGMIDVEWEEAPGSAVWIFQERAEMALPELTEGLYHFLRDFQYAVLTTVVKDIMGTWCVPTLAAFTGSAPSDGHAGDLAQALGCRVVFNAPRNEIHYPSAWLDRAPQLANPITAAEVSLACARMIDEFKWESGITRRVYRELTGVPGRFPEIETVASTLCMTSRTLRRKLEAEGTSYSDLLDGVRNALASDYLRTTRFSVEEVASLLGFSSATSFRRAFRRWTGKAPNDYRA
jgi:AraC-like DNA-binding protein